MLDKKQYIQGMIDAGVKDNETVNCLFHILLLKEESKGILEDLLLRNGYSDYAAVDTMPGCWNLNDNWYQLEDVESIIEYCGVYPVKWDIEDVVLLNNLYESRSIYINVNWKIKQEDGTIKYVPNN